MRGLILLLLLAIAMDVKADHFPVQECVIDVGFVLDGSGSVKADNWVLMLAFVQRFARHVIFNQSGARVGVVSFGNSASVNIRLDQFDDVLQFENAVGVIRYKDENTNTASGIRALRTEVFHQDGGDRPTAPNVAVVLTDGESTYEVNNTIPEATLVKLSGAKIFAIGIGPKIKIEEVNAIASDPDENYVRVVDKFSDLDALVALIVNSTCEVQRSTPPTSTVTSTTTTNPTTTTTSPTTTTPTPRTTTSIPTSTTPTSTTPTSTTPTTTTPTTTTPTTTTPTTTTTSTTTSTTTTSPTTTSPTTITTPPTITTTTPRPTTTPGSGTIQIRMELVFILDASGSIGIDHWQRTKEFVKNSVNSLTLSDTYTRVALIVYSTKSFVEADLGQYTLHGDFNVVVDGMSHLNHRTNTSGAIRMANFGVMESSRIRDSARKVFVIITDGQSNTDTDKLHAEAAAATSRDIHIFTISVGTDTSMAELQLMASRPYYHFIHMLQDHEELVRNWHVLLNFVTIDSYPAGNSVPNYQDCANSDVLFLIDVPTSNYDATYDVASDISSVWLNKDRSLTSRIRSTGSIREEGTDAWGYGLDSCLAYFRNDLQNGPSAQADNYVLFIITSGDYENADKSSVETELSVIASLGVTVIVTGIGGARSDSVLQGAVSGPNATTFIPVEDTSDLRGRFYQDGLLTEPRIVADMCRMSSDVMWVCSFEGSEPYRCDVTDDATVEFTWTVTDMKTPSRHTGPDAAYDGQFFAYIEASSPRKYGDRAIIWLPFSSQGVFCLSFRYHMFGWHIGVLDVLVTSGGREDIVWHMAGQQGKSWLYAQTVLRLQDGDRVGMRAVRAKEFSGDVGIDYLRVQRGFCSGDV